MFEDDSDFMKGFETGIMMRSKDSELKDYGCVVPDEFRTDLKEVFETIIAALDTIKSFLPEDVHIKNGFSMLMEFINSLNYLIIVLQPDSDEFLDMYCRGMIFGLKGSSLLVRISNLVRNTQVENVDAPETQHEPTPGTKGRRIKGK